MRPLDAMEREARRQLKHQRGYVRHGWLYSDGFAWLMMGLVGSVLLSSAALVLAVI